MLSTFLREVTLRMRRVLIVRRLPTLLRREKRVDRRRDLVARPPRRKALRILPTDRRATDILSKLLG